MLTPEVARERLEAQKVKGWSKRRAARIAKVGPRVALAGAAVLKDAEDPYGWRGRGHDCGPALESLSTRQRTALFGALFPGLGEHVERMWERGHARPYQAGWQRRAFRAPNDPPITLPARRQMLVHLVRGLEGYEPDAEWVARWAPHIAGYDVFSPLLAAVVDAGGEDGQRVFEVLVASAEGTDEIAAMGRHVAASLLIAEREDGWDFVERLLLAAQRQEGLRQTILESVDEAHPDAFRRMLGLILEHGLTRFSATVRALDVWLGFAEGTGDRKRLDSVLERVLRYLENEKDRAAAIAGGEAEDAYLALWSAAYEDAPAAVRLAEPLLGEADVERRWVAAYLLAQLGLTDSASALWPALDDGDLRVATVAFGGAAYEAESAPPDMFERLERLLGRLTTAKTQLDPIVWPWTASSFDRSAVAAHLIHALGTRPPSRLIPHLKAMDTYVRANATSVLAKAAGREGEVRATLLALVGDPGAVVRERAIKEAAKLQLGEAEALDLEKLLTRKAGDLRRGVITLLLARANEQVLASAERLLESKSAEQRLAGLELLRRLAEEKRDAERARAAALAYRDGRTKLTEAEKAQLDAIVGSGDAEPPAKISRTDCFGLRQPDRETPPRAPSARGVPLLTRPALLVLEELDALVHEHRDEEIEARQWWGATEKVLLGDAGWQFPRLSQLRHSEGGVTGDELPLREVWEQWLSSRADTTRDPDGGELLRASVVPLEDGAYHGVPLPKGAKALLDGFGRPKLRYGAVVQAIVEWLTYLHPIENSASFLLDASETLLAGMSDRDFADATNQFVGQARASSEPDEDAEIGEWERYSWQGTTWREEGWITYLEAARSFAQLRPDLWGSVDHERLWTLERWIELPPEHAVSRGLGGRIGLKRPKRLRAVAPPLDSLLVAYRAGAATDADVIVHLLGPGDRRARLNALSQVSGRRPHGLIANDDRFAALVERVRRRILELELGRGEMSSLASEAALELRWSGRLDVLLRTVTALGRDKLVRGWTYDGRARATVFSRIIRATYPAEDDTPERFAAEAKELGLKDARLVEIAAYAPQWATHVEAAVGWPGLADAIWWLHAHTKDTSWTVEREIRDAWAAELAERSPLSANELVDGAVDVAWFERVQAKLGTERWVAVDAAAKYCSTGGGHKRAQLFADAMRGTVDERALRARIAEKRHQDSVRALGLLPLPTGEERADVVLERYRLLQEFVRTSRQFGSQRQASEKRAAEIGLDNLARTAGYPDPIRLSWAMEAREVADLADGGAQATVGDVVVELVIDEDGQPDVTVRRGDRPLKSVPPDARKSPEVKALRDRATDLRRQTSRMRVSLEQAMVRGDSFTGDELHELMQHPLLAPQLGRLIVVAEEAAGYPTAEGRLLVDHAEVRHAIGPSEAVRVAHPVDLLDGGAWEPWQRDCLRRQVVQPFKQVFRELYVPTKAELDDGDVSRRYAGHQIQPRKALALLGGRGWVAHPEEGVRRTFHDADLTVALGFLDGWGSPVEVEAPTLEEVRFYPRGEWKPVRVASVPRRLFSEVMRDLDLVVSVAHAGGVDPEATASTIEMRAALVEETCDLLKIENVRVEDPWALIDGTLGEYSLHLGSANVHRRPGGSVCIVPVHGQHRGRIFLPFADDDPKTAEVMAKVLLLARDHEIKDPTILEQIRA
jgi:Family of unknown function (DUF5724)/Domain of unknown function (DUF4132)